VEHGKAYHLILFWHFGQLVQENLFLSVVIMSAVRNHWQMHISTDSVASFCRFLSQHLLQ
jgi:hypothetical protein